MYSALKTSVLEANQDLPKRNLVVYSWGNVSAIRRDLGVIAIKPSGVPYDDLTVDDIVVLNLDGQVVEGNLHPSSDTRTHLVVYRAFAEIGSIVHTHSPWATTWAQAGLSIPPFGTTHADYFYGPILCTRELTVDEVANDYEQATGHVIVEAFQRANPMDVPGVLVKGHASFCWGKTPVEAVHNAVVLEEVAKMAYATLSLNPNAAAVPDYVLDKHYFRKHGSNAYYGQIERK